MHELLKCTTQDAHNTETLKGEVHNHGPVIVSFHQGIVFEAAVYMDSTVAVSSSGCVKSIRL